MATAKRRGDGKVLLYTAGADIARGDVIDIDTAGFTGVALNAIANGASAEVAIDGMFEVTKTAATNTWSAGARLAISSGTVAAGAQGIHRAYSGSVSSDTTAMVILNAYAGDTT